jgi:ABC-type nitrate/sulfonate/bicarbonate transport system ATPase subunit
MAFLSIENISKVYERRGIGMLALDGVSLDVASDELICLLGVSGCGKSTLLQIVAGLEESTQGNVKIEGHTVQGKTHSEASAVFQEHGLFPWMTVRDNVAFNLKARGVSRKERFEIAAEFITLVGLNGFENRYPHELSGGMRQRVGIARAMTTRPKLLLMDEPFGALDAQTRGIMQAELLRILEKHPSAVLFVTHGVDEAILLADRVVIMSPRPGRIRRILEVPLARPRDPTSTEFAALVRAVLDEIHDDISQVARQ